MHRIIKLRSLIVIGALLALAACTKEKDITTTTVDIEKPKQGELIFLSGTVRDTSKQAIANASLRFQLKAFEQDFETDENGYFEIEVPALEEQGLIITGKSKYYRAINAVQLNSYTIEKNIYLVEKELPESVNLLVNDESLFYIRGAYRDQFDQAVVDAVALGETEFMNGEEIKYTDRTDEEGRFEFIIEKTDFNYHFLFGSQFTSSCFDLNFQFSGGDLMTESDTSFNWGVVKFPISIPREIAPVVTVSECVEEDYVNHIYRPGDFTNIYQQKLIAGESISFCDTSNQSEAWLYSGVMSADKSRFNGQFVKADDFTLEQSFSLCMPAEPFLELRFENETLLYLNTTFDRTAKTITASDSLGSIQLAMIGSSGSSTGNASVNYSRINELSGRDMNEDIKFNFDPTGPTFVNLLDSSFRQGVLTARIIWADGRTELLTIRFSV